MKKLLSTTLAIGLAFGIAQAGDMQTVIDSSGAEVTVPKNPKRMIGGHDAIITLPLYELGLGVVGSGMRKDPATGEYIIFGMQEIYGTSAKARNIKHIGGYSDLDVEAVRGLKPDVFVGNEGSEKIGEQVSSFVPYYINNSYSGGVQGNEPQLKLAQVFGAMDKYNKLDAKYQARLAEVRAKLPFDASTKTYVGVLLWDKINVGNSIGGVTKVMNDLGFKTPAWMDGNKGFMIPVSPEELNKIDQDIVFLMAGYSFPIRDKTKVKQLMGTISPGWDKFMKAAKENRIIYGDSMMVVTPTFASAMNTLDYIETYFAK